MNFFGHTWVARCHSDAAAFCAGAMLPDLAGMLGVRLPVPGSDELEAGVSLHHATDRVFHGCSAFRELERGAQSELSALRVRRGTRRAVAHVGVELMIDRALARRFARAEPDFRAICGWLSANAGGASLGWAPEASSRLQGLLRRLAAPELSHQQLSTPSLVLRLQRALAVRPRLALLPKDQAAVSLWADRSWALVESRTPAVVEALAEGLASAKIPAMR